MKTSPTVLICGSGTVAHTLALGFAQRGIPTLLSMFDSPALSDEGYDERIFAITPPNIQFLRGLGFWQRLRSERLADIAEMRIHPPLSTRWQPIEESTLSLTAVSAGVERLATLVEHRELLRVGEAMTREYAQQNPQTLKLIPPQAVKLMTQNPDQVSVTWEDGTVTEAKIFIAADGAQSAVRSMLSLPVHWREYGDACVVGNFSSERPHWQIAEQWFDEDGVFATLPFVDGQVSLAWSCRMEKAKALANDLPSLITAMKAASRGRLGDFTARSPVRFFPLRKMHMHKTIVGRIVLAGDSAHLVHPMMGLGLNLGLGDVREIIQQFAHVPSINRWSPLHVAAYEAKRLVEVRAIQSMTDTLHKWYLQTPANPLSRTAQKGAAGLASWGMEFVQNTPFIKSSLIRLMTR